MHRKETTENPAFPLPWQQIEPNRPSGESTLAQPNAMHHGSVREVLEVPVVEGGKALTWVLALTKPEPYRVSLALSDGSGRTWEAIGGDVFEALMKLRLETEPDGVQLCCNGARRNAWSSFMQRDMGEGFSTYLLRLGEHNERPESVPTLAPAPAADVATVAEQIAFHEQWLSELKG